MIGVVMIKLLHFCTDICTSEPLGDIVPNVTLCNDFRLLLDNVTVNCIRFKRELVLVTEIGLSEESIYSYPSSSK